MRALILVCLALVASTSAFGKIGAGYHKKVGFPLAEKIRVAEEKMLAEAAESRIAGGSLAPLDSHPYFAGLMIEIEGVTTGYSVCGSTLLSTNRLVTAAHCWYDGRRQAWRFTVILGTKQYYTGGTRIATSDVVMHSQYDPLAIKNDIAMIKLPTNVEFTDNIRPISLPTGVELSRKYVGNWAVAVGYGKTSNQETSTSTIANHVSVKVVHVDCVAITKYSQDSMICTRGEGGPCEGDSGGPLIFNRSGTPVLIGVGSFGLTNGCQAGWPSIFTRVTNFINFIREHL